MEDATHALLQDFVDSLANLPSEVSHLLTEVAYLDFAKPPPSSIPDPAPPCPQLGNGEAGDAKRWYSVEEARRKAATKHASIVRHAHRPPHTLMTPNPKEAQLVDRAGAHYEDAIRLSEEKQRLMTKAQALVERHLNRLNSELDKLVATTGVEVPDFKRDAIDLPASATLPVPAAPTTGRQGGVGFDFAQLGAAAGIGLTGAAGAIGTPGPGFRRRPMFQSPSLASLPPSHHPHAASHLSSTPTSLLPTSASYPTLPSQFSNPHAARQRSRLSETHTLPSPPSHHQAPGLLPSSSSHHHPPPHPLASSSSLTASGPPIHHRRAPARARRRRKLVIDDDDDDDYGANDDDEAGADEDVDMDDAEGSFVDDGAAGGSMGEEKDEELYCFCQRQSFGEMIGCDNPTCQYEWFHLSCVGLKATPANQTWFCPTCRDEKKRSGQPARTRRR